MVVLMLRGKEKEFSLRGSFSVSFNKANDFLFFPGISQTEGKHSSSSTILFILLHFLIS